MRPRNDSGFATAQMLVLLVVSFTMIAWFANVLFIQYERAAVRSALADAARQSANSNSGTQSCTDTIAAVMNQVAKGPWQRNEVKNPRCTGADDPSAPTVNASVDYDFRPWFPIVPNVSGTLSYTAQRRGATTGATP